MTRIYINSILTNALMYRPSPRPPPLPDPLGVLAGLVAEDEQRPRGRVHHRQRRGVRLASADLRHQAAAGGAQRVPPAQSPAPLSPPAGHQLATLVTQESYVIAAFVEALSECVEDTLVWRTTKDQG